MIEKPCCYCKHIKTDCDWMLTLNAENARLRSQVETAREALGFYKNSHNWKSFITLGNQRVRSKVEKDEGKIADKALSTLNGTKEEEHGNS